MRSLRGLSLALFLGASAAEAAPRRWPDTPCKGCTLLLPEPREPVKTVPLLVLLHGDEGNTSVVLPRWTRATQERNYALLALKCPRDQGCTEGSWWRWSGDPAWLTQQVEEVAKIAPLDRSRIFLAGWSGGASYMGQVAHQLRGFSGLSFSGGGLRPHGDSCAPCQPPVFFLVGDRNPLHSLAIEARDALKQCGAEVEWSLLPGKDHAGELAALNAAHTQQILAWLERHAACNSAPTASSSSGANAAPSASSAPPQVVSSSRAEQGVPREIPDDSAPDPRASSTRARGCGCELTGHRGGHGGVLWVVAAAVRLVRCRKERGERCRNRENPRNLSSRERLTRGCRGPGSC